MLKTRFFGLYLCRRHCGSAVNHFHIIGPKATEFSEITQNKSYYAVQCHQFWNKSKAHMRVPCLDGVKLGPNFQIEAAFNTNYYVC